MEDSEYINIHWSPCRIPRILLGFTSNIFFISKLIIIDWSITLCDVTPKSRIVVYSFLAWVITESITMHSVHLPFQCSKVYRLHDQKNQDNSFNFRFQIGNDRQSKSLLTNWGEFFFFIIITFFFIKTGIRYFLLDIYFAYKSFVWTAALGLEFSGSNDIVLILLLY